MPRKEEASLNIISIIIISLTVSVVVASRLSEFGKLGIAQGQGNLTAGNLTLTPEQRAAICDPTDVHVNTTESRICGIPKTPSSNTTSIENTTSEQIAPPSSAPPPFSPEG